MGKYFDARLAKAVAQPPFEQTSESFRTIRGCRWQKSHYPQKYIALLPQTEPLMKYVTSYHYLDDNEYYQLTQFKEVAVRRVSYDEIKKEEAHRGESFLSKFEISNELFKRLLDYVERDGIRTRDPAPKEFLTGVMPYSFTVYTLKFALHAVKGNRGGWFIVSAGGREPFIEDEFISYGPMRKSGTRRGSYRRKLSQSEKSHIAYLDSRTPSIMKIYEWISKRYLAEVKKIDLHYKGDKIPF